MSSNTDINESALQVIKNPGIPEEKGKQSIAVRAPISIPSPQEDDNEKIEEELNKVTLTRVVKNQFLGYRHKAIEALPSSIVNHSSNSIAAVQLVGEMMMFKANGTTFVPNPEHRNVWWRYITEPPKSIWKSVFEKAGTTAKLSDLVKPEFYSDAYKSFTSLAKATEIDKAGGRALINRWQARSTFAGLSAMTIAALLPDVKDTEEDINKHTVMRQSNPIRYVGQTIGEALWFPVGTVLEIGKKIVTFGQSDSDKEIGKYKRQFTGLGLTIAGTCSFLSGFRNIGTIDKSLPKELASNLKYVKNGAHSIGGMITAFAGSQLMLAVGSDQGWERFGAIQWLRMAFLPKSITNRYAAGDPRAHWYVGGQVGMQSANTASFLFGGAEKREDGSIVDNKQIHEEAKEKAKRVKAARRNVRHNSVQVAEVKQAIADVLYDAPSTSITQASEVERAMPERAAAQRGEAVNDTQMNVAVNAR